MRPVVLIEDNESINEVLADYLRSEGFVVLAAATARGGLEVLATLHEPALVLLDLVLPDAAGESFLNALASWGLEHRVIVISAVMRPRLDEVRTHPLVAAAFPKPFGLEELMAKVRETAAG